jgi:hypothetical protein
VIDDHDATKAKFDAIVRDLHAEHVSRATATNVTPPDRQSRPWDEHMAVRVAAVLILIAIAVGGFAFALLAAHV